MGAQQGVDNVFVTCVKFENPLVTAAMEEMGRSAPPWAEWIRWLILGISVIAGLLLESANSAKVLPRMPLPTQGTPTNPFKYDDPNDAD